MNLTGEAAAPTVEVLYNGAEPAADAGGRVDASSRSVADANQALSNKLTQIAAGYLEILLRGGELLRPRPATSTSSGCENAKRIVDATLHTPAARVADRARSSASRGFAGLAIENLDLSDTVLKSIGVADATSSASWSTGKRTPLDAFAVALAVTRVAHVRRRPARRPGCSRSSARSTPSRGSCAASSRARAARGEGRCLAGAVGAPSSTLRDARRDRDSSSASTGGAAAAVARRRSPRPGSPSAALGVAIGALARDVRAASLLAILRHAADRVPRARAAAARSPTASTTRSASVSAALPVPARAAGGRRRAQRHRPGRLAGASPTWPRSSRATASWPGWRCAASDEARGAHPPRAPGGRRDGDPAARRRPTSTSSWRCASRNRAHTEPWEPLRGEDVLHARGPGAEIALDDRAWSAGSGYAFAILDARAGDRIIGRIALANVVRGAWQNAHARLLGRRGRAAAAATRRPPCACLRFAFEHAGCTASSPRSSRATRASRARASRRRASAWRAARCATCSIAGRVGGPRHLRADGRGMASARETRG